MRSFSKTLIALGVSLSFLNPASALILEAPFKDVPSTHPNALAISVLKESGVISGYPDGTFKPDQQINRVEALKIILLSSNIAAGTTGTANFKDIDQNEWYIPYLSKAIEQGIVNGYPDGTFQPTQTVKLAENLKMVILANKIDLSQIEVKEAPYSDASLSEWYIKYLQYAKNMNLVDADESNKVYPALPMTRGKLADVLYRQLTINKLNSQPEEPTEEDLNKIVYQVSISDGSFSPSNLIVPIGTTVRFTNNGTAPHNITFSNTSLTSSEDMPFGQYHEITFNKEGDYDYQCTLHSGMTGKISVKPAHQVPTI